MLRRESFTTKMIFKNRLRKVVFPNGERWKKPNPELCDSHHSPRRDDTLQRFHWLESIRKIEWAEPSARANSAPISERNEWQPLHPLLSSPVSEYHEAATRELTAVLHQVTSSIENFACTLIQDDEEKKTEIINSGLTRLMLGENSD